MADIADQAAEMTDFFLARSMNNRNTKSPAYTGKCLHCGDDCGNARYCDRYCREDHEKSMKKRR